MHPLVQAFAQLGMDLLPGKLDDYSGAVAFELRDAQPPPHDIFIAPSRHYIWAGADDEVGNVIRSMA